MEKVGLWLLQCSMFLLVKVKLFSIHLLHMLAWSGQQSVCCVLRDMIFSRSNMSITVWNVWLNFVCFMLEWVTVDWQANFDIEVEAYRHHLERVYRLCHACDLVVRRELAQQNALIRARMHGAGLLRSESTVNANLSRLSDTDLPVCRICFFAGFVFVLSALICNRLCSVEFNWSQCMVYLHENFRQYSQRNAESANLKIVYLLIKCSLPAEV